MTRTEELRKLSAYKRELGISLVLSLRDRNINATLVGSCSYYEHTQDRYIDDIDIVLPFDQFNSSPERLNKELNSIHGLYVDIKNVDDIYLHFGIYVSSATYKSVDVHFIFRNEDNKHLEEFKICPISETTRFLESNLLKSSKSLSKYLAIKQKDYEFELSHDTITSLCRLTNTNPVDLINAAISNANPDKHLTIGGIRGGKTYYRLSLDESLSELVDIRI